MNKLNDLMSFGHVVYSDGNGNVTDEFDATMDGPEVVYVDLDADGQLTDNTVDMSGYGDWDRVCGYEGGGFSNGIMHSSQYIGGNLETHIRETAGYYVAVFVDGRGPDDYDDESEPIGWAVAFKEEIEVGQ